MNIQVFWDFTPCEQVYSEDRDIALEQKPRQPRVI